MVFKSTLEYYKIGFITRTTGLDKLRVQCRSGAVRHPKLWDAHSLLCKKGKLLYEIGFSGIGKTLKISVNSKCYREHQGICSISIMSKLIYLLIEYIYSWIVNHLSVKHPWINAWPPQTSMIELLQK